MLLLGTGLTMVDVALELGVSGGPVMYAMSRSGLLPRVHQRHPTPPAPPPLDPATPPSLDKLVAVLTSEVVAADDRGDDWRPLIDSLRPISNEFWGGLGADERARFQREYGRLWSVHRHRMAPQVGARSQRLIEKGRLRVAGGDAEDGAGPRRPRRRRRGPSPATTRRPASASTGSSTAPARCTIPERISTPLVQDLVKQGSVRSNELGVGFDTDPVGTVIGRRGDRVRHLRDRPAAGRRPARDHRRAGDRPAGPRPLDRDHRQRGAAAEGPDPPVIRA